MRHGTQQTLAPTLALFASVSTLLCCALPALLIALGAGAVMAGLASNIPALIWLSARKEWTFAIAGLLLALAAFLRWRSRNAPCPIDPAEAHACMQMRRAGGIILWLAVACYAVGGFFAFFAADLLL